MRVVVVDNDPAVLDLLLLDLQLEGHDVLATFATGEEVVAACDDLHPDVLIVDLRLGQGIDGLEVARRVISAERRVVLHTNYVTPAVVKDATSIGAVVVEKGSLNALRRAVVGG